MQREEVRRRNLSRLLSSNRSRLTSQDVGLPEQPGRRQRGLAREQVAFLSGTDLRWYGELEDGELNEVDPGLLSDVATALRLSAEERTDLFCLAARVVPPNVSRRTPVPGKEVLAALEAALPHPALVTDHAWNVLAANAAVEDWFCDPRNSTPPGGRNSVLWLFTEYAATRIVDIEEARRSAIARLQIAYAMCRGESVLDRLVQRVIALPCAAELWREERASLGSGIAIRQLRHPAHGERSALFTSTELPGGLRLLLVLLSQQAGGVSVSGRFEVDHDSIPP